ncbi:hypothetical protein HD597_004133 [Nonomuraea thailandensis]|uniref:Uncharacterized protein n=1 Tax=Nonomuraea thailandensis TaxID=1188745 RepID=A0A9X2K1M0_9ACTN|nr:hypothetical protein [Nonomuraea thailandensis]MCP2357113.1 hypothetical protein [Nonomuraea thailandensis]
MPVIIVHTAARSRASLVRLSVLGVRLPAQQQPGPAAPPPVRQGWDWDVLSHLS